MILKKKSKKNSSYDFVEKELVRINGYSSEVIKVRDYGNF